MDVDYLIDCGNSRCKIAANTQPLAPQVLADSDLEQWFAQAQPGQALLLPGNEARAQRCEKAAAAGGLSLRRLDVPALQLHCNQYDRMGWDRLCAGIAAVQHCQSDVIVIDAGTMLTLTAWRLSEEHSFASCFVAGYIFPGAQVCLTAMHQAAPALPLLDLNAAALDVTAQQMQGAVQDAWPAVLAALCQQLQEQVTTAQVILTGGARDIVPAALAHDQQEDLVLRGLQLLAADQR